MNQTIYEASEFWVEGQKHGGKISIDFAKGCDLIGTVISIREPKFGIDTTGLLTEVFYDGTGRFVDEESLGLADIYNLAPLDIASALVRNNR